MTERTDAAIGRNVRNALASQLPIEDLELLLRRYKAPELRSGIVAFVAEMAAVAARYFGTTAGDSTVRNLLGVELAQAFPAATEDESEAEEDTPAAEPTE